MNSSKGAWLALALGLAAGWAAPLFADSPADATVTVTPMAGVSLTLDVTAYAFGPIDVNTSTHSALPLTLTNNGELSVTVDKVITDQSAPTGWTAAAAAGPNTYVLYASTAASRPMLTDFTAATMFGALANNTPLTGPSGNVPTLDPGGPDTSVQIWFRLDMPTTVSSLEGKTITVRFTGVTP